MTAPELSADDIAAVLDVWFRTPGTSGHNGFRPVWFEADPLFDEILRSRFGAMVSTALDDDATGDRSATADAVLARILLSGEFPRRLFPGSARAYAGDAAALALAESIVSDGRDKNLPPLRRWFAFMPFVRSETLLGQERSVALFAGLRREGQDAMFDAAYDYARFHRDIVERFGRFPQRNSALGRVSTDEEEAFLRQIGPTLGA